MPQLDGGKREFASAGEAMQNRREGALPALLAQDSGHFDIAVARMNHEWQSGFARSLDVLAEALLLRIARTVVTKVIQARFADCNHLWVLCDRNQSGGINIEFLV